LQNNYLQQNNYFQFNNISVLAPLTADFTSW